MSKNLKNPVNQVRLTNVAVIRLKKGGKKFELACYRNKALNWRSKTETDINEVLQIDKIFTNVSKGDVAKKSDLKVFGDLSEEEIIQEILNKGEMQVSDLEREDQLDNLKKDIANIIVSKCVNTKDQKQFPVSIIVKAMNEVNVKINPTQSAKKQALEFIKDLQKVIPIERAKMRIKVIFPKEGQSEEMKESLKQFQESCLIERESERFMELMIAPNLFREINDMIRGEEKYAGVSVEIEDQ
jgi:ribosome maturation protein SDO1